MAAASASASTVFPSVERAFNNVVEQLGDEIKKEGKGPVVVECALKQLNSAFDKEFEMKISYFIAFTLLSVGMGFDTNPISADLEKFLPILVELISIQELNSSFSSLKVQERLRSNPRTSAAATRVFGAVSKSGINPTNDPMKDLADALKASPGPSPEHPRNTPAPVAASLSSIPGSNVVIPSANWGTSTQPPAQQAIHATASISGKHAKKPAKTSRDVVAKPTEPPKESPKAPAAVKESLVETPAESPNTFVVVSESSYDFPNAPAAVKESSEDSPITPAAVKESKTEETQRTSMGISWDQFEDWEPKEVPEDDFRLVAPKAKKTPTVNFAEVAKNAADLPEKELIKPKPVKRTPMVIASKNDKIDVEKASKDTNLYLVMSAWFKKLINKEDVIQVMEKAIKAGIRNLRDEIIPDYDDESDRPDDDDESDRLQKLKSVPCTYDVNAGWKKVSGPISITQIEKPNQDEAKKFYINYMMNSFNDSQHCSNPRCKFDHRLQFLHKEKYTGYDDEKGKFKPYTVYDEKAEKKVFSISGQIDHFIYSIAFAQLCLMEIQKQNPDDTYMAWENLYALMFDVITGQLIPLLKEKRKNNNEDEGKEFFLYKVVEKKCKKGNGSNETRNYISL